MTLRNLVGTIGIIALVAQVHIGVEWIRIGLGGDPDDRSWPGWATLARPAYRYRKIIWSTGALTWLVYLLMSLLNL